MVKDELFFRLVAPVYDFFTWHHCRDDLEELLDLHPESVLLDLGGGTGELVEELTVGTPVRRAVVLDANQSMLRQGHSRRGHHIRALADRVPLQPGTVDRFLMTDALHHMDDVEGVFEEISRLAGEEARLVVEEFNTSVWSGRLISRLEHLMGLDSRFYSPEELVDVAARFGFTCEEVRERGFLYYACFQIGS
jgi:ubiquinone/menaquinone biosynthesis C-methylase UbiE